MSKKNLIILTSVIVVIVAAVAGYFIFYSPSSTNNPQNQQNQNTQNSQNSNSTVASNLKLFSDEQILDYWINYSNTSIYTINQDGQINKIDSAGAKEVISSQTVNQLNSIKASPNGTKIIAKFNYPSLPTISIFDTVSKSWQPINGEVIDAAWSLDGKQIALLQNTSTGGKLSLYNVATKKSQDVIKLSQKDARLDWLKKDEILIAETPSGELQTSIYSFNLTTKTFKTLVKNQLGLMVNWQSSGDAAIKTTTKDRTLSSSFINASGVEIGQISAKIIPDKCLFGADKIFCALAQNLYNELILPDDYYKKDFYSNDKIYKIDLQNSQASTLLETQTEPIDAIHLSLINNQLLFINRYDQKIYFLKL